VLEVVELKTISQEKRKLIIIIKNEIRKTSRRLLKFGFSLTGHKRTQKAKRSLSTSKTKSLPCSFAKKKNRNKIKKERCLEKINENFSLRHAAN